MTYTDYVANLLQPATGSCALWIIGNFSNYLQGTAPLFIRSWLQLAWTLLYHFYSIMSVIRTICSSSPLIDESANDCASCERTFECTIGLHDLHFSGMREVQTKIFIFKILKPETSKMAQSENLLKIRCAAIYYSGNVPSWFFDSED